MITILLNCKKEVCKKTRGRLGVIAFPTIVKETRYYPMLRLEVNYPEQETKPSKKKNSSETSGYLVLAKKSRRFSKEGISGAQTLARSVEHIQENCCVSC